MHLPPIGDGQRTKYIASATTPHAANANASDTGYEKRFRANRAVIEKASNAATVGATAPNSDFSLSFVFLPAVYQTKKDTGTSDSGKDQKIAPAFPDNFLVANVVIPIVRPPVINGIMSMTIDELVIWFMSE